MSGSTWLVAFLAAAPGGVDVERLQTGLYVLGERGVIPPDQRYRFEPYRDAPRATEIFEDLDRLLRGRLVAVAAVPGSRWREYRLTMRGRVAAADLGAHISEAALRAVAEIRRWVEGTTHGRLTRTVDVRYPGYRRPRLRVA